MLKDTAGSEVLPDGSKRVRVEPDRLPAGAASGKHSGPIKLHKKRFRRGWWNGHLADVSVLRATGVHWARVLSKHQQERHERREHSSLSSGDHDESL